MPRSVIQNLELSHTVALVRMKWSLLNVSRGDLEALELRAQRSICSRNRMIRWLMRNMNAVVFGKDQAFRDGVLSIDMGVGTLLEVDHSVA